MLNVITTKKAEKNAACDEPKIKSLRNILIDSAAIGLIAGFSVWAGTSATLDLLAVIKAFGLAFAVQIVYERAVKKAS